jgi:two-component system, LuxR family, response regulator FixJ
MPTAGRRIYVVDDDESVCRALSRLLQIAGYSPESYSCGEDFLNRSSFDPRACVVCDIRMPGLDGVEVWNLLRNLEIELPFIFMTAVHDEAMVREAKRVGMALFWKPVDGEELIKVLETIGD